MNLKDLLSTDHEAIAQWLMHAFRWWIDELMTLVPPEWRDRLLQRNAIVAELKDDGIEYRDEKTNEILREKPRGAIRVLVSPDKVLTRQVDLPILPASDIRRIVSLDLDRLTPFQSDQILFDTEILARDEENGRQKILLGVLPRSGAAQVLERIRAVNLQPAAIGVASAGGTRPGFDFLPSLIEAEGGSAARRRATYFWAAVAVLIIFNVFLLNYRGSNALDQLRETVESQQAPVTVAMRLRDKVEHEATRRADLLKQQAQSSPLRILDAVTQVIPSDAWVERFEWNGRAVHIRGFRKGVPDLLARLEASPVLRNARSLASDSRAGTTVGDASFELTADRQTERNR
jgi:general secretion pathway protein L